MKKHNRTVALLLSAALCFLMLFSVGFLAEKSFHNCMRDNCPVCAQLEMSRSTLRNISAAVLLSAVTAVFFIACLLIVLPVSNCDVKTLVSLKVKLSD